jgi:acyl carrier protein phosphodiesterase
MNFLSHIYLSGENEKLMVGNFIGDFVKGKRALEQFEPAIVKGIELHRTIDEFTDTHRVVSASKDRLRPKYRHYSGVIVDVFYDHFLAKNWDGYHAQPLPEFAAKAYHTLKSFDPILPKEVKQMLPYMTTGNWLVNYGRTEGIHRALSGMASRTPYDSKMDEAITDLVQSYAAFQTEFESFFPELRAHCERWISQNTQDRT